MNTKEIKQEIVNYGVSLSVLNANNIKTGLLSMNKINPLEKELLLPLSHDTEEILKEFVDAYEEHTKMRFEKYESGILFQYVFDRAVEVTYKVIMGLDIDTQYILNEPFDGYNIDIPEYIQLKLTNRVEPISLLYCEIIDYIDKNEYRTEKLSDWLLPVLLVAAIVGIEFAQEMDLDNDDEMQQYLEDM